MAFVVSQVGNKLYKVDPATGTATELTLPSGVTLSTSRKPRFAILGEWVAIVNSPSRNLVIDPEGTVRVMVPRAPTSSPILTASGTGLTGDYKVRSSFFVLGTDGELLMESPLSPISNTLTCANQGILCNNLPISPDSISGVRLYRTAAGGTQYFRWIDKDGNEGGSLLDNMADATLSLLPVDAGKLLTPPGTLEGTRMRDIIEWGGRLWGLDEEATNRDTVYYTEANKIYQWANSLIAHPAGQDEQGVIGFLPRRDQLGIIKRDGVWQITGKTSFTVVQIAGGDRRVPGHGGGVARDTLLVVDNVGYWLGKNGFYEWSDAGIKNISQDQVDPWFSSDTHFNRSRFPNAFAVYNEPTDSIHVHLAAAGSSSEDRWVSYDRRRKQWFGPHKTATFTPVSAALVEDENDRPLVLVGGTNGIVYKANQATRTDGSSDAIDFDVFTKHYHADAPDIEHYWGLMSILSRIEAAGTLSVTPYLGGLDAAAGTAKSHTLTTGREVLSRVGFGRLAKFRFRQNTAGQDVTIYGFEVPHHEVGRR
jgi:hypothetical protein